MKLRSLRAALVLIGWYGCLLVGGELALRSVYAWHDGRLQAPWAGDAPAPDPRALRAVYDDADYDAVLLWEEIGRGTERWLGYTPYTVWRRQPFQGELVRVDAASERVTTDVSESESAFRVWVVGGSTTWGMGTPDRHTIPSQLARALNGWGLETHVRNLGETGYVSTQEALSVIHALQEGERPHLVIAYDGANEGIGLAEAPDVVNPHYLTPRFARIFAGEPATTISPLRAFVDGSGYRRLARRLRRSFGTSVPVPPEPVAGSPYPEAIEALAARAARVLLFNHDLIATVGRDRGFATLFFHQPALGVGAKPLHASEEAILAESDTARFDAWVSRFLRALRTARVAARAAGHGPDGEHDLTDLFADQRDPVYVDWVHLGHRGNELVAEAIAAVVRRDLCDGVLEFEAAAAIRNGVARACEGGA